MAEIRGTKEHCIRIERGRGAVIQQVEGEVTSDKLVSVNKPTDSPSSVRGVKSKLTEGQHRERGGELPTEIPTEPHTKDMWDGGEVRVS